MRIKSTIMVAGLAVAGFGATLGGTGTVGAADAATGAPRAAPVDCAAIEASFGSAVPDAITTFYDAVPAGSAFATTDAPLTAFIPTNAAFDKIPANVLDAILADNDLLTSIVDYHVILGQALTTDALVAAGTETSAVGDVLTFAMSGDTLTINGGEAVAVCTDFEVAGAVLYIIDGVLQPASLGASGGCGTGSSTPGSSSPTSTPDSSVPCESTPSTSTA
jgi:transforming growth factor-beta-induced protein